jgi:gas vesicle protein
MQMAVQHDINEILETIRKELPSRAHDVYEEAVRKAMRQRNRRQKQFARGMLRHNPMLRQEWNRQQEEEGALAIFMLVIGLIGGAALMYLFDPDRGARRRAAIQVEVRRATENASEAVEETVDRVRSEVSRVTGEAEDKAEELGDQAKTTANNAVNAVRDTAADTGDQVKRAVNKTASSVRDSAARAGDQVKATADKAASEVSTPIHNVANERSKP